MLAALKKEQVEGSALAGATDEDSRVGAASVLDSALKPAFTTFDSLSFNFDRDSGKYLDADLNTKLVEICEQQENMLKGFDQNQMKQVAASSQREEDQAMQPGDGVGAGPATDLQMNPVFNIESIEQAKRAT